MRILTPLKHNDVERVLRKLGYEIANQKGSHRTWKKSGKVMLVTVVVGRDEIARGTLRAMITKQMGLTIEEFLQLLYDC